MAISVSFIGFDRDDRPIRTVLTIGFDDVLVDVDPCFHPTTRGSLYTFLPAFALFFLFSSGIRPPLKCIVGGSFDQRGYGVND